MVFVTSLSAANKLARIYDEKYQKTPSKYPGKYKTLIMHGKTSDENADIITGSKNYLDVYGADYDRKLIFATNAVEFSVTFSKDKDGHGLEYVVDTGAAFVNKFDAVKNAYILGNQFVTQANIKQRCGRTGRDIDGDCYTMYTKQEFESFPVD